MKQAGQHWVQDIAYKFVWLMNPTRTVRGGLALLNKSLVERIRRPEGGHQRPHKALVSTVLEHNRGQTRMQFQQYWKITEATQGCGFCSPEREQRPHKDVVYTVLEENKPTQGFGFCSPRREQRPHCHTLNWFTIWRNSLREFPCQNKQTFSQPLLKLS